MRKLLTTTTALSVALTSLQGLPLMAQEAPLDAAPACISADDPACANDGAGNPLTDALDAERKRIEAELAAKQAEAEAEAIAREQAAAEAAAQAESDRAAAAEAAAAAAAEADAQAAAAAETARIEAELAQKAADEAAASAAAEAEAAAADAASKAAEEALATEGAAADAAEAAAQAAARAEAEAIEKAEALAAEQAEADAAARAAIEAEAAAANEAAAKAEAVEAAPPAGHAAPPRRPDAPTATPAETAEPATPEAVVEAPPAVPAAPLAEVVPGLLLPETAQPAEPVTEQMLESAVEAPKVEKQALESLASILGATAIAPAVVPGEAAAEARPTDAPPAEPTREALSALPAPVAAAAEAFLAPKDAKGEAPANGTAREPISVITEALTRESTRTSDREFDRAPVQVSRDRKSGLSDLDKVGLVALGALAVGAIISANNGAEARTVVSNSGDRVVVQDPNGHYQVYKDDDAVLRRPGVDTRTESYRDGSTRTVVTRPDGSQVVTVRDASGRVLKRSAYDRDGIERRLIDDLAPEEPIRFSKLPRPRPDQVTISTSDSDAAMRAALAATEAERIGRKFSLRQIRDVPQVRALAATIEVDSITFDTGSSVIRATEARKLADLGRLMKQLLAANPAHVFLVEGHTDAVGSAASNLLLSDRRAESLALALTEYFEVPPENLVVQGYGEGELKVPTQSAERANRRVLVRLITPLMRQGG